MNVRALIRSVRTRGLQIAALAVVGVAVAGGYVASSTPQYESTTRVYVSVEVMVQDLEAGASFDRQLAERYADVATTPFVLDRVVTVLGLEETSAHLAGRVEADVPDGESVIAITATDPSPQGAARIANAVADRLTQAVASPTPSSASAAKVELTRGLAAVAPTSPTGAVDLLPALVMGLLIGAGAGFALAAAGGRPGGDGDVRSLPALRTT